MKQILFHKLNFLPFKKIGQYVFTILLLI